MAKVVRVRDVPDLAYRKLRARAAQSGMSLSEYLRAELARVAALPNPDEVRARLRELPPVPTRERPEAVIRRLREGGR